MRAIRLRFAVAPVLLAFTTLWADVPSRQQLQNPSELHDEIQIPAANAAAVPQYLPSFLEYQDLIMFHPKFGYYGSGRVSFSADYQTFPIVLSPYFGQMITQQIFHMWQGMRQAGTLGAKDPFTIAEFGAGDGALAEQILTYLDQRSNEDAQWHDFAEQTVYVCYDRSPALSQAQQTRNARFGKRFAAREADATNPTATIPAGSLKGVVLSNELPDAFSVHKVILSAAGLAEVAYVAPSLPAKEWNKLAKSVPAAVAEQVAAANEAIQTKVLARKKDDTIYLSRAAFVALLEALVATKDYEKSVQPLEFHEVYVPARAIPELAAHLRRYAHLYGEELAKNPRGVVTYINLGEEEFVQGAGRILGTGYVLTIDYGDNWDGILTQDRAHLRTYGPAHLAENDHAEPFDFAVTADGDPQDRDTSDPYRGPTLNDITTDVNFSLMEAEGRAAGLSTKYFGRQKALATGTTISIDVIPPARLHNDELTKEYQSWLKDFKNGDSFKLMVQQKADTDSAYKYPDTDPEPLSLNEKDLTPAQQASTPAIEKALAGQ
jgi:SAM-dependent MidA family methyltransferase